MKAVEPLNMHGYNFPQKAATGCYSPVRSRRDQPRSLKTATAFPSGGAVKRTLGNNRKSTVGSSASMTQKCFHHIRFQEHASRAKPQQLSAHPKPQHFHGPLFKSASDQDAAFSPWPVPNLPLL